MAQTIGREALVDSPQARVDAWLERFEAALTARDVETAARMFATESYWRDLVAFTWNIKTVEGREGVADLLHACLDHTAPSGFRVTEPPTEADGVVEAWLEFDTATGRGQGHLRLTDEGAWTLLTALRELKGFEEPRGPRRPQGVEHGVVRGRRSWAEQREREQRELGYQRQPYVVVIGGGQGGIALGARLRQLDVPSLVVERHARPGDSWRTRYRVVPARPRRYDHLPYLPFLTTGRCCTEGQDRRLAEMYVRVMEVPY